MPFEVTLSSTRLLIPMDVSELTIGQLIAIRALPDHQDTTSELIAILSKTPVKHIQDLRFSIKSEIEMMNIISLTNQLSEDIVTYFNTPQKFETPKSITILNKTIDIPQDLQIQPFWPSRKVKQVLQKRIEMTPEEQEVVFIDDVAEILAHYLYVPFTGLVYRETRADEFVEVIKDELSVRDAIALNNFFLSKWKSFLKQNQVFYPAPFQLMKSRLRYRILKFLGISSR